MPSRRHSSAMLASPRRPSSTMRIFSSAENCRRVARRMSFTTASAGCFTGPDVCFIFALDGYDEPEILRSRKPSICLTGADAGHGETTQGSARRGSRDPSLRLRFRVLQRDDFKCCACGASPATSAGLRLQVDHIVPWSVGGETTECNLQTLCVSCNLGRSNVL